MKYLNIAKLRDKITEVDGRLARCKEARVRTDTDMELIAIREAELVHGATLHALLDILSCFEEK